MKIQVETNGVEWIFDENTQETPINTALGPNSKNTGVAYRMLNVADYMDLHGLTECLVTIDGVFIGHLRYSGKPGFGCTPRFYLLPTNMLEGWFLHHAVACEYITLDYVLREWRKVNQEPPKKAPVAPVATWKGDQLSLFGG